MSQPQGPTRNSLIKYEPPVLMAEKDKKAGIPKKTAPAKLPPVTEQGVKSATPIEELISSIIPPR
jgi:hypothetical protein